MTVTFETTTQVSHHYTCSESNCNISDIGDDFGERRLTMIINDSDIYTVGFVTSPRLHKVKCHGCHNDTSCSKLEITLCTGAIWQMSLGSVVARTNLITFEIEHLRCARRATCLYWTSRIFFVEHTRCIFFAVEINKYPVGDYLKIILLYTCCGMVVSLTIVA